MSPDQETASQVAEDHSSHWAIVLAGGDGLRMESFIKEFSGERMPRQFCTFMGTRSMIQHTFDRLSAVVSPEHIITIIGHGQRASFDAALAAEAPGEVFEQPMDRGTAPAIFLALTHILEHDPGATVIVVPANQFVFPEERFVHHAIDALTLAEAHSGLILIGATPDGPDADCEWIQPDKREWTRYFCDPGRVAMEIHGYRESPSEAEAGLLYRWGWLINTTVFAVRAKELWELGWEFLPQMMQRFEIFHSVVHAVQNDRVDANHREIALAHIYRTLEPHDFSAAILQHVTHRSRVLPMTDVCWSAWNSPQSIKDSLTRLGIKCPAPLEQYIERRPRKNAMYFDDLTRTNDGQYRNRAA